MATAASDNADRILSYTLLSKGKNVTGAYQLTHAKIYKEVNRLGNAIFKFDAGDMPGEKFAETDSDDFKPGASIEFKAGDTQSETTIFSGTVMQVGIQLEEDSRAQMVVECCDCAFAATLGRKNKIFEKKKDNAVISEVLKPYGSVSVDSTSYEHPVLVQYYCSDWDFALSRADANGLVVIVDDGKISVKKPEVGKGPAVTVTYGTDLIEFDGHVSVTDQFTEVEAVSWNPAQQAIVQSSASKPTLNKQGDLSAAQLKGGDKLLFQTDAPTQNNALKNWADSVALKNGLARYQGSFTFYGNANVKPGCIVELKGLGKRFNGNVYVGMVEHTIENNVWITRAGMGIKPDNITEKQDVTAPPASGWLPGIEGLHIGKVKKLDGDPDKENRIQIEVPLLNGNKNLLWARLATVYGGNERGVFFIPEKDDEVLVGFFNNDPRCPVILGNLYSSKLKPPYEVKADNYTKAIVTKTKMKIEFNEEKKIITLVTPGKNKVEINDDKKSITLSDQNKNTITMDKNGITLNSGKDIVLKAKANIKLDATAKASVSAKNDVALEGMNVKATAKIGFTAKGNATAELSASGQTTVKGAMVMIN